MKYAGKNGSKIKCMRKNGTIGEKNISVASSLSELGKDMGAKPNNDFLLSEVTEKYRDETSNIATKIRLKLTLIRQISEKGRQNK